MPAYSCNNTRWQYLTPGMTMHKFVIFLWHACKGAEHGGGSSLFHGALTQTASSVVHQYTAAMPAYVNVPHAAVDCHFLAPKLSL